MANVIYGAIALTGGTEGALDAIDGAILNNNDMAVVIVPGATAGSSVSYTYNLNATSAAAESSPKIIAPDVNAGNKRWILQPPYGVGDSFLATQVLS